MAVQGDTNLFKVVGALGASRSLTGGLNGGQENPDQCSDDGNDHQDFYECKPLAASSVCFAVSHRAFSWFGISKPSQRRQRRGVPSCLVPARN